MEAIHHLIQIQIKYVSMYNTKQAKTFFLLYMGGVWACTCLQSIYSFGTLSTDNFGIWANQQILAFVSCK